MHQLKVFFAAFLCLAVFQGCAAIGKDAGKEGAPVAACNGVNTAVGDYFAVIDRAKKEHPGLAEALSKFPKGADLHNHLSGTVMPEDYIAMGTADGDCYGPDPSAPEMFTIRKSGASGACDADFKPLAQAGEADKQRLVQSLSMERFDYQCIQSGHDQFFATFGRFGAVSGPANTGKMLAKLLQQENRDSVTYVETMMSFHSEALSRLAGQLRQKYPAPSFYTDSGNYPILYDYLLGAGLRDAVSAAQGDITAYVAGANAVLRCGAADRDPACGVSVGFQATVNRNAKSNGCPDLATIFTQTAFSMLLSSIDRRVVGVNLLSGEDLSVSMQSFKTQMQFFRYFHNRFPKVNIALHGGEITPYFVGEGNTALKEHLTDSLKAGAKRIGHGVSFAFLSDADKGEVANLMKVNDAAVEVPFTSNAQILGVAGEEHPFSQYFRRYGIPAPLSTDDEGVSHADFTSEWIYAVMQYGLTFGEAVRLARYSIQYSFIPGEPLWADVAAVKTVGRCAGDVPGSLDPAEPCRTFLAGSEKAKTQWDYEAKLSLYAKEYGRDFGRLLEAPRR